MVTHNWKKCKYIHKNVRWHKNSDISDFVMASLYSADSGDTVQFGLDSAMDSTPTPNGTRTM